MTYPAFFEAFDQLDLPFPDSVVTTRVLRSTHGLAVFFDFHQDAALPPHSHKGQWGTVIEGRITLTIDGVARSYGPGESYDIPSGTVHAVEVTAGTKALDVFEEPDRYALRPRAAAD
jgi:quercetin dioxygenase-like cupin family protein